MAPAAAVPVEYARERTPQPLHANKQTTQSRSTQRQQPPRWTREGMHLSIVYCTKHGGAVRLGWVGFELGQTAHRCARVVQR